MNAYIRVALVILTGVLMQLSLFNDLRIADVAPELVLAIAIVAGMTGGSERGAVVGFVAGLLLDLFLATPFGLSALTYSIVAYLAGMVANAVIDANWLVSAPVVAVGSVGGLGLYVLFGELLGQEHFYTDRFWWILLVAGLYNGVLGGLITRVLRWAWQPLQQAGVRPTARFGMLN
ncbi:MAG: rod shape-determining protein MreD [Acidimicrobiia bacterium]|nr:rod shape-determining protein MreD [Acidimicrobiia bacterium]